MEGKIPNDLEEDFEEYEDEVEPWSLLRKIIIGTVSTVVLLSFTLWAGGFNLLQYQKTPPSKKKYLKARAIKRHC